MNPGLVFYRVGKLRIRPPVQAVILPAHPNTKQKSLGSTEQPPDADDGTHHAQEDHAIDDVEERLLGVLGSAWAKAGSLCTRAATVSLKSRVSAMVHAPFFVCALRRL
jgi:hypothetical protein